MDKKMSLEQVRRAWFSFLHNCIAHPLLFWTGNSRWAGRLHDWSVVRWLKEAP